MALLATTPFPITVEARTTTDDTGRSGSTLSLNIPVGVQANEILYAIVTERSGSNSLSFPAGWTVFWENQHTSTQGVAASGAWKLADGTESGTISVTLAGTSGACGIMYRISGCANPNLVPPLASSGGALYFDVPIFGDSCSPPPVYFPGLKCEDALSICSLSNGNTGNSIVHTPEEYTNNTRVDAGSACYQASCERNVYCSPMEAPTDYDFGGTFSGTVTSTAIFFPKNKWTPPSDMAYVRSMDITDNTGRVTTTTFKLRLPQDMRAGDILLGIIAQPNVVTPTTDNVTWPDDWTEIFEEEATSAAGATPLVHVSCAWKKVDGSEGRTVTIPTIPEEIGVGACFAIGGQPDPSITPPEFQDSTFNTGLWSTLTPSWGTEKTLWFAITACEHSGWDLYGTEGWRNDNFSGTAFDIDILPALYPGSSYLSRSWCYSNDTSNTENVSLMVSWAVIETASQNPSRTTPVDYNGIKSCTLLGFKPGSFDPGDWWYLGWEGKGRGGTM